MDLVIIDYFYILRIATFSVSLHLNPLIIAMITRYVITVNAYCTHLKLNPCKLPSVYAGVVEAAG